MPLGNLGVHAGKWFIGPDSARERFLARFPTVDEKVAFSAVEAALQGAGDKPGDPRPRFDFAKSMKAIYDATLPLLDGHEANNHTLNCDETRAALEGPGGGAYFEEVAALGAFLFRPTSEVGDTKPAGDSGAAGVSEDASAAEGAA